MSSRLLSDPEIVKKVLEGDHDLFSSLIIKYKNYIYTIIIRNNYYNEDADEIFQEVFYKILKNLKSYNSKYQFKNWIFTITLNYIRNKKKYDRLKHPYQLVDLKENQNILIYNDKLEKNLDDKQIEKAVNNALSQLSKKYFQVIILFYYENESYENISKIMKKPIGTVKTYLFRAKEILQKKLKQFDISFV